MQHIVNKTYRYSGIGLEGRFFISLLLIAFGFSAIAQEDENLGTEVVNVVKPYTPTISDAFKAKETPSMNDSIRTQKKEVEYNIFSVPVASTFTPAKGKATAVEKAKPLKLYDSYASLGFGNYTSILGELYSNFQISRTDNAGFFFRHNSSQGDVDGVFAENKYYDTQLDANYTSRQRDASYRLDAGLEHQLFNWYGIGASYALPFEEFLDPTDIKQTYFSSYVGGEITIDESLFEGATAKLRYTADAFSSSEVHFNAKPTFSFPLRDFDLKIDSELDYISGSFDRMFLEGPGFEYSYLNAGVAPSFVYLNDDLTLSLGVAAYVSLNTKASESSLFVYPRINVSYRLVDAVLIVYGGADGGLDQNSYYGFKSENPFVSPTLLVAPTSHTFNGFAGIKGKLSNEVGYNVRASYSQDENHAFFNTNVFADANSDSKGYEYGNSFQVVYDDLNTLDVFGELKIAISENFSLGASANIYSYDTKNETEAWNKPSLKATVFSNFNFTEKLYGGASLFYVGERKDRTIAVGPFIIPDPVIKTLDPYLDANVHLGYHINERFSVFAKGSNLIGENYEKWYGYPVQSIQLLAGATYKFDW